MWSLLWILFVMFILSIFYWDNDFVKKYIWNNKRIPLQQQMIKWVIFIWWFLFLYLIISSSVNKLFLYTSVVSENGIIIDLKNEWIESSSDAEWFNKSLSRVWNFLNNIDIPYQDVWWSNNINWTVPFVYKELSVKNTNILFSSQKESDWLYIVNFEWASINPWWDPNVGTSKLYLNNIATVFNKTKNLSFCLTNRSWSDWSDNGTWTNNLLGSWNTLSWSIEKVQVKDVNNIWTSILDTITKINTEKAWEIKNNVWIIKKISEINNVYKNIYNSYLISVKKDFIEQDFANLWWTDAYNYLLINNIVCLNNTPSADIKVATPDDINKLILNPILESLLTLQRFSEEQTDSIQKEENKIMFLANSVSLLLSLKVPDSYKWTFELQDWVTPKMDSMLIHSLSNPFIVSFDWWNKVLNAWICYNYLFWPDLEAFFTARWFWYINNILNQSCSSNFWKIYHYKDNSIYRINRSYFAAVVDEIKNWQESNSIDKNIWEYWFVRYWNFVSDFQNWTNNTYAEAKIWLFQLDNADLKNYVEEFSNRISKTNNVLSSFIFYIRDIILSLFIYLIPWIFLVLVLKLIRK